MNFLYPFFVPVALSLTAYNAFLTGLIVLLKRNDVVGQRYFMTSFTIFLWGIGITFMLNNELSAFAAPKIKQGLPFSGLAGESKVEKQSNKSSLANFLEKMEITK